MKSLTALILLVIALPPLCGQESGLLTGTVRDSIGDRSAILISHRFSTVRMADLIYVLDQGRVIEHGSHSELLDQNGYYARFYHAQADHYQIS